MLNHWMKEEKHMSDSQQLFIFVLACKYWFRDFEHNNRLRLLMETVL